MFLRKPLHKYLLWGVCVFGFLAIISSFFEDGSSNGSASQSKSTTTSIPPTTTTIENREYTVQPGDSMYKIAQKFNLSAPELVRINNLKTPDRVPVGTVLKLPASTGFVPIGATTTMQP